LIDTVASYTDSEGIIHAETNKLQFNIHAGINYYTDFSRTYYDYSKDKEFEYSIDNIVDFNAGIRFNIWKEKLWIEGRTKLYTEKFKPFLSEWNFYLDYNLVEKLYFRFETSHDVSIEQLNIEYSRNSDLTAIGLYYNYIINNPIEFKMPDPVSIEFYAAASYILNHNYLITQQPEYDYIMFDWPDALQTIIGLRINIYKNILYYEQNLKMYTSINGWIGFTPFYSDYTSILDVRIENVFLRLSHTCYHPIAGNTDIIEDAIAGQNTSFGIVYNLIR
jgi:hypothetical protein